MAEHCCTSRFFAVEGYLRLTHSFSVISEKITINHILPKTRFLGLYLLWHKAWFYLQPCDVIDSKDIDFGRITHNNGHYAVPGPFKVTIFGTERKFVCDFLCVNNTTPFRAVSKTSRIYIDQIFALDREGTSVYCIRSRGIP